MTHLENAIELTPDPSPLTPHPSPLIPTHLENAIELTPDPSPLTPHPSPLIPTHLQNAIELLQSVTQSLTELAAIAPADRPTRETVEASTRQIHRALAELSATIDRPSLDHIPPELLRKAEELGIPLDDIEIRVAITTHDLSQFVGILNEIEQRFGEIRRVREYLIVRLPDIAIERLGSRLPVYTAADFEWKEPRLTPSEIAAIRDRYQIDRLIRRSSPDPTNLSHQIEAAKQAWEQATVDRQSQVLNDTNDISDLPF